jgi:hypothetical protein
MNIDKLLLKTAFSCMACDGEIDKRELLLIKKLHQDTKVFGLIDIDQDLEILLSEFNQDSYGFLRLYFDDLSYSKLSEQDELKLIELAIGVIKADDRVEYGEIKFFKVIRSNLKINNESILAIHPDFEDYLEQDIMSETYLSKLKENFFDAQFLSRVSGIGNSLNLDFSDFLDVTE